MQYFLVTNTVKRFVIYFVLRFWSCLYNHFDMGLHPRQSVLECLTVVKKETQQLEEELASYMQVNAMFQEKQAQVSTIFHLCSLVC